MDKSNPSVIFLRVTDAKTKVGRIVSTIEQHFARKERILIQTDNAQASDFINDLLWKTPPESFIPHVQTEESCDELIAITTSQENVNKASVLLNLRSTIPSQPDKFDIIYELFDETHPTKAAASQHKQQAYSL